MVRLSLVLLLATLWSGAATAGDSVDWSTDIAGAFRRAAQTSRPVLVQVTANPCGYKAPIGEPGDVHETDCERLETDTLSKPDFAAAAARFVPVILNFAARTGESPAERDSLRRWKVGTVPTLLVADPWGNEVIRLVGPTPLENTLRVLRAIPADFKPLRAAGEALRGDPDSLPALLAAASFYETSGLRPVAERYYGRAAETPAARAAAETRRSVVIPRGLNLLQMGQAKEASHVFADEAARGPDGERADAVLFGWAMAEIAAGDRASAQHVADDLAKRFPQSPYAQRLQQNLKR
jgi:hypothetical protein